MKAEQKKILVREIFGDPKPSSSDTKKVYVEKGSEEQFQRSFFKKAMEDGKFFSLDFPQFEKDFTEVRRELAKNKPEKFYIIDLQRLNNIQIAQKKLKFSVEELKAALESSDIQFFRKHSIDLMISLLPEEKDLKRLMNLEPSEVAKLSEIELFLSQLATIPLLREIFETFKLQNEVQDLLDQSQQIGLFKEPLVSVLDCKGLQTILLNLLRLSNYLNEGTKNGNTKAITFDSLLNLSKIKGREGKSLLHFAMKEIYKENPYYFNFVTDLLQSFSQNKLNFEEMYLVKSQIFKKQSSFEHLLKVL